MNINNTLMMMFLGKSVLKYMLDIYGNISQLVS